MVNDRLSKELIEKYPRTSHSDLFTLQTLMERKESLLRILNITGPILHISLVIWVWMKLGFIQSLIIFFLPFFSWLWMIYYNYDKASWFYIIFTVSTILWFSLSIFTGGNIGMKIDALNKKIRNQEEIAP